MSAEGAPIWRPLSRWRFRALWIASIISNCGSWIYTITVQWKVTSMSMSPSSVSMVLVAASLPQFLFLLPAGVLCDLVDRRRLLLAAQLALILLPSLLGIAIWA
ncbi:MAG TPA: MFS transporter, partial [Burkholderiales bacterium]|nr:MFS transporter [Burkholderiales bacterium]